MEDSPTTSRVIRTTLHDLGYYYVETAADGVQALQKLAGGEFHCIITDWNMPNTNGLELVKAIKANKPWLGCPYWW